MKGLFSYHIKSLFGIIIPSICFIHPSSAQNLVPNWSFEMIPSCPNSPAQVNVAFPWDKILGGGGGSPDYFNSCNSFSTSYSIPSNVWGYQYAHSGNADAFVLTYLVPEYREYMQVPLKDSLKAGKEYCVEFYVSAADKYMYAADGIGAYFSKTPVSSSLQTVLPYTAQVNNPAGNILTDSMNWTKIIGSFMATGGEVYMVIGNFKDDANTNTSIINNGAWNTSAGYYIDDVSVILCSDTVKPITPIFISSITLPLPNIFTPNNDGTNDVFSITSKNIKTLNCKIYNRWGILVGELKTVNDVWDGRNTAGVQCTDGVYYYILTATGFDEKEYSKKGFLQLVK